MRERCRERCRSADLTDHPQHDWFHDQRIIWPKSITADTALVMESLT